MSAGKHVKVLVTGGCRSGKSEYALRTVKGCERKVFIAIAEAKDEEMKERIKRHREKRGKDWRTVEEPIDLGGALAQSKREADVVVIDCITLWLSNLLGRGESDDSIMERINDLARKVKEASADVVIVTNEVGWGIVPGNEVSRRFRDLAGLANQRLAQACDRVVLMVAGMPVVIKEVDHGQVE